MADSPGKFATELKALAGLVFPPGYGLSGRESEERGVALDGVEDRALLFEEVPGAGSGFVELTDPAFVCPHGTAKVAAFDGHLEERGS